MTPLPIVTILFQGSTETPEIKGGGYNEFYSFCEERGILLCRASIESFDERLSVFSQAQFFESGQWKWRSNIQPDLIYDKTSYFIKKTLQEKRKHIAQQYPLINPLELSKILSDKWETYQLFSQYSPESILLKNSDDFFRIQSLPSKKIIIKPTTGSGGAGIFVCDKKTLPQDLPLPCMVQEFIEAGSVGNFVSGPHDLRILIREQTPFYAFLRIPSSGSFIANLSRGGRILPIPLEQLPKKIEALVEYSTQTLSSYSPKLYSLDCLFDKQGIPWILELNSRPGIILEKEELSFQKTVYNEFFSLFTEALS